VTPELEAFELSDFALPKGVQILLTDDSLLNRYVGAEMIQNMGGNVTLASSGESATVLLQQRTFDVVLMDINLPGKDGLEISRWIRKYALNPTVPVIALTAHDLSEVRQQCQDAGMDDFLAKPFEYQDLYRVISQVLDRPTVRQV
jgi:CheY-like chemotaxis protein